MKTKETVFVKADTKEKTAELYKVLKDAKQPMTTFCESQLSSGKTNYQYFGFDVDYRYSNSGVGSDYWLSQGRTEVSIATLAVILGVASDEQLLEYARENYPIGTRCETVYGVDRLLTVEDENFEFYNNGQGRCILVKCSGSGTDDGTAAIMSHNGEWAEIIPTTIVETPEPTRTITREALSEIYSLVCDGWKDTITGVLAKTDVFSTNVVVSEKLIKQAYQEANETTQLPWLKKYLPAPTIKETVEAITWGLADEFGNVMYIYNSKETAESNISKTYPYVVELKGSYTVEVEDPEYDYQLPF